MYPNLFGEFFGTMVLIAFGDGVVACLLLNDSKGNGAGWVHINWGWAFSVMLGVFAAIATGAPQADLNPAVTLAKMMAGVYTAPHAIMTMAAEMAGAFTGAVIVYLLYLNHWEGTDPGLQLAVFSTGPGRRNPSCNFLTEVIATFFLVTMIMCVFSAKVAAAFPGVASPFMVAGIIYALGSGMGGPTGYALNPARDLGPRLAHAVLPIPGKGDSDWGYSWIPIAGPMCGGALAFMVCRAIGLL